jgi:hypothetical protein
LLREIIGSNDPPRFCFFTLFEIIAVHSIHRI